MLDDLAQISKLDKGNILLSIEHLPQQIENAWREVQKLDLTGYEKATNIVVAGMGGSALGGRIIHYLEFKNLRAPIEIVTNYHLPKYVNENTLVILSSYSGNTEETISCAYEAIKRKAKIIGIEDSGKLMELLQKENLPFYDIDAKHNPSGQPRMGLGYSISALLTILSKLNFITYTNEDFKKAIAATEKFITDFGPRIHTNQNHAKKIAEKLATKIPILISSEHLIGSAHAMKNQLNENAKTFAAHFEIPEINHHLLEGLKYPNRAKDLFLFVFLESNNYFDRIQKRYPITQDVIKKNGYNYEIYKTVSTAKLEEVFEILVLGSYVSFYLAMLHGIDPSPIPWVDYFKEKMNN